MKKKYFYNLILIVFFVLFNILKGNTLIMEGLKVYVTLPLINILKTLASIVPFSLFPFVLILFAAFILFIIAKGVINRTFFATLSDLLTVATTTFFLYIILWGANYHAYSFSQKAELPLAPVSPYELLETTVYYANLLNSSYTPAPDKGEIFHQSKDIFNEISKTYPFLEGKNVRAKKVLFSEFMSYMNITGIFFPFTGEANVNAHPPLPLLPVTIAHELAHQRGIAKEEEANFVGIMAASTCGDDFYSYSAYLLAFIYLGNALYDTDKDVYGMIYNELDPRITSDLRENDLYWQKYDTPVATASTKMNDQFLKSNSQKQGVKSYDMVTNLLVSHYKNLIK